MSRKYANMPTAVWDDEAWCALDALTQWLYDLLQRQKDISAAGMLPLTVGRWSRMARDVTQAVIWEHLYKLAAAGLIVIDEVKEEVLLRSFVADDNGYNNRKRRMVIEAASGDIRSRKLRRVLAAELVKLGLPPEWTREEPADPSELAAMVLQPPGAGGTDGRVSPDQPPATPPVDNPVDNAFSQVDRPYQKPERAIPENGRSDRVVVTEEGVVRTSTHNPHSVPPPAAPADAEAAPWLFDAPTDRAQPPSRAGSRPPKQRATSPAEGELTAQQVVAAFVNASREAELDDPTSGLIGRVSRDAKRLLEKDKVDPQKVLLAAQIIGANGWQSLDYQIRRIDAEKVAARNDQGRRSGGMNGHVPYQNPKDDSVYLEWTTNQ